MNFSDIVKNSVKERNTTKDSERDMHYKNVEALKKSIMDQYEDRILKIIKIKDIIEIYDKEMNAEIKKLFTADSISHKFGFIWNRGNCIGNSAGGACGNKDFIIRKVSLADESGLANIPGSTIKIEFEEKPQISETHNRRFDGQFINPDWSLYKAAHFKETFVDFEKKFYDFIRETYGEEALIAIEESYDCDTGSLH